MISAGGARCWGDCERKQDSTIIMHQCCSESLEKRGKGTFRRGQGGRSLYNESVASRGRVDARGHRTLVHFVCNVFLAFVYTNLRIAKEIFQVFFSHFPSKYDLLFINSLNISYRSIVYNKNKNNNINKLMLHNIDMYLCRYLLRERTFSWYHD